MKFKTFILFLATTCCLCACGTSAQTTTETPATNLVPQTDPLVVELDSFENRTFGADRAYITICNGVVNGQIPSVSGMITSRVAAFSGPYALLFNNCQARVYEPRLNKKGTHYSFTVYVEDAQFFNSFRDTDWRLSFTVDATGFVTMLIESTTISQVRNSSVWSFRGHVNSEAAKALQDLVHKSDIQE